MDDAASFVGSEEKSAVLLDGSAERGRQTGSLVIRASKIKVPPSH